MTLKRPDRAAEYGRSGPGECAAGSGCEGLFELVIGDHYRRPGCLSSQPDDKKPVVVIDESFKIIPNCDSTGGCLEEPVGVQYPSGSELF